MKKIGITGNIAAGKSAIENLIKAKGFHVIDADEICHELLSNNKNIICSVKKLFYNYDILDDEKLNRAKIAKIVFQNNELKIALENLLHPIIKEKIEEFFELHTDEKFVFASVPLLFEVNMQKIFDKILLVIADDKIRLTRLMNRNNLSEKLAMARINAQNPQAEKITLADFVIENNNSFEDLEEQIEDFLKFLH